jgi:hypothetical protein
MVIYLLYLQNIPHSRNGLPTPPREYNERKKQGQEFVTVEFEIRSLCQRFDCCAQRNCDGVAALALSGSRGPLPENGLKVWRCFR